jgi:hypothetical protein
MVAASGSIKAVRENPAVPKQVLLEILLWKLERAMEVDVIARLRERTVPHSYKFHTWNPGIT